MSSRSTISTKPEKMKLTLENSGEGFGLGISDKLVQNEVPVIYDIEPKSPADRVGVLKTGDRILAINGVETSHLFPSEFSALKKLALTDRTIKLKVGFDVRHYENIRIGSFDVVLDDSLKLGLTFKDMKEGKPMIIKEIRKGSGAHRSGNLFPGDAVSFIKFKKKQEFDPLAFSTKSAKSIVISVMRHVENGLVRGSTALLDAANSTESKSFPFHRNSSSSYKNLPFHKGNVRRKNSVANTVSDLDHAVTSVSSDSQIRAPHPCRCNANSSNTSSLNEYFQKINMPKRIKKFFLNESTPCSPTKSYISFHDKGLGRIDSPVSCASNLIAPRQTPCNTNSSISDYSNLRFQQGNMPEKVKKIMKNKSTQYSSSRSAVVDEVLGLDRISTAALNVAIPQPSPCKSDSTSYLSLPFQPENTSQRMKSLVVKKLTLGSSNKSCIGNNVAKSDLDHTEPKALSTSEPRIPQQSSCSTDSNDTHYSHLHLQQKSLSERRKYLVGKDSSVSTGSHNSVISDDPDLSLVCIDMAALSVQHSVQHKTLHNTDSCNTRRSNREFQQENEPERRTDFVMKKPTSTCSSSNADDDEIFSDLVRQGMPTISDQHNNI